MQPAPRIRPVRRAPTLRVARALYLALIVAGLLTLQLAPWHAADHLSHADDAACGLCQIAQHAGAPATAAAPSFARMVNRPGDAPVRAIPTLPRRRGQLARAPPPSRRC